MDPKIVIETAGTPKLTVTAQPGDGAPTVTSGYGNVDIVGRALRRSITRWTGKDPIVLSVPLLLDGYADHESVEGAIERLERMAGLDGDHVAIQRRVNVTGPGRLIPHEDEGPWLITDLAWGDAVASRRGHRLRQAVQMTLTQFVEPATEKALSERQGGGTHARTYVVRKGDTLRLISRKVFGTANRWDDIRKLNGIGDPRIVGKPGKKKGCIGTTLRMPRA